MIGLVFINAKSPLPAQYNILAIVLACILYILSLLPRGSVTNLEVFIYLLVMASVPNFFLLGYPIIYVEDCMFFFGVLIGCRLTCISATTLTSFMKKLTKIVNYSTIITFIIGLLGFKFLFDYIFIRFYGFSGTRLNAGLFGEPSFLVITYFSIWVMIFANHDFKKYVNTRWQNLILPMTTASTMIIFLFLLHILTTSRRFWELILIGILVFIVINIIDLQVLRFTEVILLIVSGDFFLDQSISSRLFYILKDAELLSGNYFMFHGIGSYDAIQREVSVNAPEGFLYDPYLSGSLLGRLLVELGFVIIVPLIYFLIKAFLINWRAGLVAVLLLTLSLQMISMAFLPFSIGVGFFIRKVLAKNERATSFNHSV